jgi:putative FmdB family regulatory protein
MAIYEFICHDCEVIWEREAPMSKAPSRSRCPECKKLKNRHWGEVPVMFNGSDYYTNKRKMHNTVYHDKAKAKQVQETLLDAAKRTAEDKTKPYRAYNLTQEGVKAYGGRHKTEQEKKLGKEMLGKIEETTYNNSAAYRKLRPKN